jgi:hypothetical protein
MQPCPANSRTMANRTLAELTSGRKSPVWICNHKSTTPHVAMGRARLYCIITAACRRRDPDARQR